MKQRSSGRSKTSSHIGGGSSTSLSGEQPSHRWHRGSTSTRTSSWFPSCRRYIFGSFCTILLSSLLISFLVVTNPVSAEADLADLRQQVDLKLQEHAKRVQAEQDKGSIGPSHKTPSLLQVVNEANRAKCVEYPPIVKEIALKEIDRHVAQLEGKDYKPEDKLPKDKCLNICDLCKERPPIPPTTEPPVVPPKSLCLGDPPVVVQYLPYTTRKVTTSVHFSTPTGGDADLFNKLPGTIGSHAELQNKILRADLPQDVIAKLLATYLYDQDEVTLNNSLQNLAKFTPFENQEPPKPVGFNTKVAIMMFVNKYYECNENPADLRDLKY